MSAPTVSGPVAVPVGVAMWGIPVGSLHRVGQDGHTTYVLTTGVLRVLREDDRRVNEILLDEHLAAGLSRRVFPTAP